MGSNHLPSSGGAQAPPHQRSASGREFGGPGPGASIQEPSPVSNSPDRRRVSSSRISGVSDEATSSRSLQSWFRPIFRTTLGRTTATTAVLSIWARVTTRPVVDIVGPRAQTSSSLAGVATGIPGSPAPPHPRGERCPISCRSCVRVERHCHRQREVDRRGFHPVDLGRRQEEHDAARGRSAVQSSEPSSVLYLYERPNAATTLLLRLVRLPHLRRPFAENLHGFARDESTEGRIERAKEWNI
jgi:hypothetical protein